MTPYKHAESSANKWGGIAEDYLYIHRWFDETKAFTGDWTHRALRHHSAGIEWACKILGDVVPVYVLGKERKIPTRQVAEQHVLEDCGFIPTPQDWLRGLVKHPDEWMLKVKKTTTYKI